jgi:hypothetical protein
MSNTLPQTLILAVPGTQETREWEFASVREAVARGEIGLDNWAWSPSANNWIPLAELPEFAPAVTTTEVYSEPTPDEPRPPVVVAAKVEPIAVKVPKVATPAVVPAARVQAVVGTPNRMPATYYSKPMEDSHEFPVFKVLFAVLALVIGSMLGVNYFLVDQPFRANMAKTPFATVTTHAHLGAFLQPNALLIHVLPSAQLNSDNFADFLAALTQSAPSGAIPGQPFTSFSITSKWLAEYMISADDWKGFADMAGLSADQKKAYVLQHLENSVGGPLVPYNRKDTAAQKAAREDRAWNDLVAHFEPKAP